MKDNHETKEHENEKFLACNPTHVNIQSSPDDLGRCPRRSHDTTHGLNDEAQHVRQDKPLAHPSRPKPPHTAVGQEEVHHAGERHVHEGVHPQGGKQEEQLVGCGEADVLLVEGTQRASDEGHRLP